MDKATKHNYLILLLQRRTAARVLHETQARFDALRRELSAPEMHDAQEEADRLEEIAAAT